MPKNSLNVSLKGADDIFSTEESRQEQQREQVQQIPIGELFPFKNHPFKVLDDESKSRHVSKRGSPHLRHAVFLVANIILTLSHKDNSVFCFMDKKRAEGKHYYIYTIAGSAKFLRIYYARVTEYLRTQEIPVAASCLNGYSLV